MSKRYAIEFRNGGYFRGPKSEHSGTAGEAMRFNQEKHARQYADRNVPWVWWNGGMVVRLEGRT